MSLDACLSISPNNEYRGIFSPQIVSMPQWPTPGGGQSAFIGRGLLWAMRIAGAVWPGRKIYCSRCRVGRSMFLRWRVALLSPPPPSIYAACSAFSSVILFPVLLVISSVSSSSPCPRVFVLFRGAKIECWFLSVPRGTSSRERSSPFSCIWTHTHSRWRRTLLTTSPIACSAPLCALCSFFSACHFETVPSYLRMQSPALVTILPRFLLLLTHIHVLFILLVCFVCH